MKTILIGLALIASAHARAESYHTSKPSGEVSKFDALRTAIMKPSTVVYKCSEVKITSKGTFKNVPTGGKNDFIDAVISSK
jgi:hypothetical protein